MASGRCFCRNVGVNVRSAARIRARRGERGASLVEFAIVAPILFMFLFGIIDFGVLFGQSISAKNGVRTATRAAVVGRFGPETSCTTKNLSSSNDPLKRIVCNAKAQIGLPDDRTRVKVVLLEGNGDGVAAHQHYDDLMLCTQTTAKSISGFFSPLLDDRVYNSRLVMMIEKAPTNVAAIPELVPGQEDSFPAGSWDFCDTAVAAP